MEKPTTIEAYIEGLPVAVQSVAQALKALIREAAPDGIESIRYGMPAVNLGEGRFIYFAVWKRHVGLYPIYRGAADLEAELAQYRSGKDTVQFALGDPLPGGLVRRIVEAQVKRATR